MHTCFVFSWFLQYSATCYIYRIPNFTWWMHFIYIYICNTSYGKNTTPPLYFYYVYLYVCIFATYITHITIIFIHIYMVLYLNVAANTSFVCACNGFKHIINHDLKFTSDCCTRLFFLIILRASCLRGFFGAVYNVCTYMKCFSSSWRNSVSWSRTDVRNGATLIQFVFAAGNNCMHFTLYLWGGPKQRWWLHICLALPHNLNWSDECGPLNTNILVWAEDEVYAGLTPGFRVETLPTYLPACNCAL